MQPLSIRVIITLTGSCDLLPHALLRGSHPAWCLTRRGDLWFFSHNSGLQAQNVLYVQRELDGDSAVLLDPNLLSTDGTVRMRGEQNHRR